MIKLIKNKLLMKKKLINYFWNYQSKNKLILTKKI